jgi:hypothetical protein
MMVQERVGLVVVAREDALSEIELSVAQHRQSLN